MNRLYKNQKTNKIPSVRRLEADGSYVRPKAKTWGGSFCTKKNRRQAKSSIRSLKWDNSSLSK